MSTCIEPFPVQPLQAPIVEHVVLIWWMHNDSGIKSIHGWWPSKQGRGHAHTWHHSREEERKIQWNQAWSVQGGYWVQNSQEEEWDHLIHRVSQFFPRRQFLHESRCCCICMAHWSNHAGCCFFHTVPLLCCTAANMQSLNFSQKSRIQFIGSFQRASKQPLLGQACLSCCLTAPNPPPLQSCSERDPTQNLEEKIRWRLFFLTHSISLSCVCFCTGRGML